MKFNNKFDLVEYLQVVTEIVQDYFDLNTHEYMPHIGEINSVCVYYNHCVEPEDYDELPHPITDIHDMEKLFNNVEFMAHYRSEVNDYIDEFGLTFGAAYDKAMDIVEYKPTAPKDKEYHYEDYIQVYLQKLCVDNIFDTDCGAVLYYSDVKKRVPLSFDYARESLNELVHDKIKEMRGFIEKGFIPEIKSDQKCDGCSMKDMCMPNSKSGRTVHQMINRMI